jgi:hypothetical protein
MTIWTKLAMLAPLLAGCRNPQPPLGMWCSEFRDQVDMQAKRVDALGSDNVAIRLDRAERIQQLIGYAELGLASDVCGAEQGDSPDEQDFRQMRVTADAYEAADLLLPVRHQQAVLDAPHRAELASKLHDIVTALTEKTHTRPPRSHLRGSAQ